MMYLSRMYIRLESTMRNVLESNVQPIPADMRLLFSIGIPIEKRSLMSAGIGCT